MTRLPISVIIHTLNEEKNLKNCLESVKWADEIILVDMYSDDNTVEIAKNFTDKIFFYDKIGYIEPARKFAIEKVKNEWVLILDADEMVPVKLRDKLGSIVSNDIADVVLIPHNNYFFGNLIKRSGWGALQDMHYRFFKKTFVNFSDKIHSDPIIKDDARLYRIENSREGFIHFNYIDVEQFVEKMNRYTTIEAKGLFDACEDINSRQLILRIFDEFKLRFITFKGYKEGFNGLSLSLIMVMYRLVVYMKLEIMRRYNSKNPREKIVGKYQKIADEIISEYDK